MKEGINIECIGHVVARYADTNEIIIDHSNAVHPRNMALILARALAHEKNSWADYIALREWRHTYWVIG